MSCCAKEAFSTCFENVRRGWGSSQNTKQGNARMKDSEKMVSIRLLKAFAVQLPKNHPLKNVLLQERDTLTASEFIAKMETWQALL
jgi:hypothetical protein